MTDIGSTHALHLKIKDFPSWPTIRERIIDFGPLLHFLWPAKYNDGTLHLLVHDTSILDTCLNSILNPSLLRYAVSEGMQLQNPDSIIKNGYCLFLVFRREWEAVAGDNATPFSKHHLCFQSIKVMETVRTWWNQREKMQQQELLRIMWGAHGLEAPFGYMFQTLYINNWLARKLPTPFQVYRLYKWATYSEKGNSKYTCSSERDELSIDWNTSEPIVQHEIPNMQIGTFYYECFLGPNVLLADAFIANDTGCYALNMTRSEAHDISETGLEQLFKGIPTNIKDIYLVYVLPALRRRDFEISSTTVDNSIKIANEKGKSLRIRIADYPLSSNSGQ